MQLVSDATRFLPQKTGFGKLFKGITQQVTLETQIDPETVRLQTCAFA